MADRITRRDRVVYKHTVDGNEVVELTDWCVVNFDQAGLMLEPVDTTIFSQTGTNVTKPVNGFIYTDRLTYPGTPWLGDINAARAA